MTPKEKAIELVDKFYLIEESQECDAWIDGYLAKKCAIIAVEEIINANGLHPNDTDYDYNKAEVYWKQVKTEIENL
jgi:hypothetical protein